jgi:hypothetical protein
MSSDEAEDPDDSSYSEDGEYSDDSDGEEDDGQLITRHGRVWHHIKCMPSDSELRNGLDTTNYRTPEFIAFCYSALENVTTGGHTRYIGHMIIDGWNAGRPARRSRILGRRECTAMMLDVRSDIRKKIGEMFTFEQMASEAKSICFHVEILDPVYYTISNARNRISVAVVSSSYKVGM